MAKLSKKQKEEKRSHSSRKKENDHDRIFKRSLFYAISMFVVFQLILVPLQLRSYSVYWFASIIGLCVVVSELLYSRRAETRKKIDLSTIHFESIRWREHFLHHAVLPVLLYVSGVLFLFFNKVTALDQVAIVILSATFFAILYNLSATYLRMYRVTRNTRLIFDFINIIVFYFGIDVLINASLYEDVSRAFVFFGATALTLVLIGLMISITKQFSKEVLGILVATSVLVGLTVYLVWLMPVFNVAVLSLVSTVMFYLVDVYWHHSLEGSFSWDVMTQYILYALMAVILLLYI